MLSRNRFPVFLGILAAFAGMTFGCGRTAEQGPGVGGNAAVDSLTPEEPAVEAETEDPGDDGVLEVGDAAPPISIDKWVTGEPIASLQPGRVYVVEFWATWCPPCRDSMPHLSQLQQRYSDEVSFIGVTSETEDIVRTFLAREQSEGKTWNDVVTYRLAVDSRDATTLAYMVAAGQAGIPTAFIVGRTGKIEWIGHPMAMDGPLEKIVAGS